MIPQPFRTLILNPTWRLRGLAKSVISRVIIRETPFRVLITLLITHLLSPLNLQVEPKPEPLPGP